jgi:hypothetical protein
VEILLHTPVDSIVVSSRLIAALCALPVACGGAQSEDARFRSALAQTPPMVNPALTQTVDPAISASWDSTYRLVSFSPAEVCFLAEWDVPSQLAPTVRFSLEGWRSLDDDRGTVPSVVSSSMELLTDEGVAHIKANDAPAKDDAPPEVRALRPGRTPMRVCFPSSVIGSETHYLVIKLAVDEPNGRHHETAGGWRLVAPVVNR